MKIDLIEMVEYSFGSVWALELLLLLHRKPDRSWSHDELVGELRSSDVVVQESLQRLLASGLIVMENGKARYAPTSTEVDNLVSLLDEEYRARPTLIRRMIVQGPAEKLKTFSDAFKLKPGQ
ncbi:hypothetical protein ABGN05_13875 [Aquibium sp. LZ166]|uniref:Transcriptional regulator n=1 Tax=Aquibium pacificus TaxID=3153579 RepID=A0ABV3SLI4_9HYPH